MHMCALNLTFRLARNLLLFGLFVILLSAQRVPQQLLALLRASRAGYVLSQMSLH